MKNFTKWATFVVIGLSSSILWANAKPLTLATEASYPPFESVDNRGQMVGFDIDILNAICINIHKACRFVNTPWDSLVPGLQLGKFDVIFGSMNITEDRQKQVDFTQPYYTNTGTFIAAKSSGLKLSPQALQGKTIGVQGSTTYEYYLQATYGKQININRYASIQDAFLDLQSGRIDAVFGDTPILLMWLNAPAHSAAYTTVGEPVKDEKFFNQGDGFAVKKGNTELLQQLDQGLRAIKADGTYHQITQKYFGNAK